MNYAWQEWDDSDDDFEVQLDAQQQGGGERWEPNEVPEARPRWGMWEKCPYKILQLALLMRKKVVAGVWAFQLPWACS